MPRARSARQFRENRLSVLRRAHRSEVHSLSAPHQVPYILRAILAATLAATLSPVLCVAAEPEAASYQSAFEGYRAFDAAYEQLDWQKANAAVAGMSHEAMHSTAPPTKPSEHEHVETRDVAPQDEADSAPAADPHAGHEE